jgi:hypothetical protein
MSVTLLSPVLYRQEYSGVIGDTKPTIASHAGLPEPTPGSKYYEFTVAGVLSTIYFTPDGTNWKTYIAL